MRVGYVAGHGLEPEVDFGQFQELILEGIREYKTWCDLEFREKSRRKSGPEYYLKALTSIARH